MAILACNSSSWELEAESKGYKLIFGHIYSWNPAGLKKKKPKTSVYNSNNNNKTDRQKQREKKEIRMFSLIGECNVTQPTGRFIVS